MNIRSFTLSLVLVLLSTSTVASQTIEYQGVERTYVVRAPDSIGENDSLLPLVIVLHGGGGNAEYAENTTGFSQKAQSEGFIVVYPEGSGRFRKRHLTWNASHCCGRAMNKRVDDVGFINVLIDKLLEDYPIDPQRIYATGMSNGGMMAHRLGRELSSRIAAVAPVVATLFGDEEAASNPVSALMINGMLDKSVPYQGGPPGGRFARAWDGIPAKPAAEQGRFWARSNQCIGEPVQGDSETVLRTRYPCPAGIDVELYLVKDNGHAWPGGRRGSRFGDEPSQSLDATSVIWDFFKAHPKR